MRAIATALLLFSFSSILSANTPFQQAEECLGKGELPQAVELLQSVLDTCRIDHPDHSTALHELGKIYVYLGEYELSEAALNRAIELRAALFGEKSLQYTESLLERSYLFTQNFRPEEAMAGFQEAVRIRKEVFGDKTERYDQALAAFRKQFPFVRSETSAELRTLANGVGLENFIAYTDAVLHLCQGYVSLRKRDELRVAVNEVGLLFLNNPQVPAVLEARYYEKRGYLDFYNGIFYDASHNLRIAMGILKRKKGGRHPDYLTVYTSYLQIDPEIYRVDKRTRKQQEDLLPILKATLGQKSQVYLSAKNNLARTYSQSENSEEAERLFEELADEIVTFHGDKVYAYRLMSMPITGLAVLYTEKGMYREALILYRKLLSWQEKMFDETNLLIPTTLANIGSCYLRMQNMAGAERYLKEAMDRMKQHDLSWNSMAYRTVQINLALVYSARKEYKKSLDLLDQVQRWIGEPGFAKISSSNPIYESLRRNMTNVKLAQDPKRTDLEQFLCDDRQTQEKRKGRNSIQYLTCQHALAVYHKNSGQYKKAWELFEEEREIADSIGVQDEPIYFKLLLEMAVTQTLRGNRKKAGVLFQQVLDRLQAFTRGSFSLFSSWEREEFWLDFASYFDSIQQFVHQGGKKQAEGIGMGYNAELFSKALLLYIQQLQRIEGDENGQNITLPDVSWQDVRDCLAEGEAAIEFVTIGKDRYYAAYLLRKEYKHPLFVSLGTEKKLMEVLEGKLDKEIYKTLWKPIEKHLKGVETVYIAPSGFLHTLSFAGIKTDKHYLIDRYNIRQLLSTRDLVTRKEKEHTTGRLAKTAALFGGADFGLPASELAELNITRGQGFVYLPGSKSEVETIANQLSGQEWTVDLYTDIQATEEQFKQLSSRSPIVIHLSTHGFYSPETERKNSLIEDPLLNPFQTVDSPMKRSGLLFTGANHAWLDEETETEGNEGILTAYEVSQMDLRNTELVVLSACNTGLGDLVGNEGTYGLQRAFRLAGVPNLIVSLWRVPDKETAELMTAFYAEWTAGKSIEQAFVSAQKGMKEKYPNEPDKWAGFVLIAE